MNDKWDRIFLDLADYFANKCSKDPATKVGALIARGKRIVSMGYNGFPAGVDDSEDRYLDKEVKHLFVAHAERNALDNAPFSVEGCTIYVPLLPCNDCAKAIVQRGIVRVVTYVPDRDGARFNWDATQTMFREAGIKLDFLER